MENKINSLQGKKITCSNCGYTWTTMSKMKLVSCPSCLNKTLVEQGKSK